MFIASIVGSSWNSADASGLAPIRSPAETNSELRLSALERADVRREELGAARHHRRVRVRAVARRAGVERLDGPGRVGLDVAVEVVERQQLDLDRPLVLAAVVVIVVVGQRHRREREQRRQQAEK